MWSGPVVRSKVRFFVLGRREKGPEAVALVAPALLTADLAENPPREQRRYACDCGIGVEASRVFPRLP